MAGEISEYGEIYKFVSGKMESSAPIYNRIKAVHILDNSYIKNPCLNLGIH